MNQTTRDSIRISMFTGVVMTSAMIALALYMQYVMHLQPCPLCSVQRAIVIVMGIIYFIGFVQNPSSWGRRTYGFLLSLVSATGLLVAGRHTWLQHLPEDRIPECGPGLEFWMNNLPAEEVVQKVFQGSGECAKVAYNFIGLSIAEWSLIAFSLFLIYNLKLLFLGR